MTSRLASVIIRTKNEAEHIRACLTAVLDQDDAIPVEIVVVDSGSSDDTVAICREFPVQIIEIPPEQFNYGYALNLGFAKSQGSFLLSLSAHAIPTNRRWLAPLISALDDPRVAAAWSRELPFPDADPYERRRIEGRFDPVKCVFDQTALLDGERFDLFFSNVSSCIRRSVWEAQPFEELPYGEDAHWSTALLEQGHVFVYEPASMVFHSHKESLPKRVERELAIYRTKLLKGAKPRSLWKLATRSVRRARKQSAYAWKSERDLRRRLYWAWYFVRKEARFVRRVQMERWRGLL